MTAAVYDKLKALCASPPTDLVRHFENPPIVNSALGINVLGIEQAIEYSTAIQTYDLSADLGLITLHDAEDSNPYCYITKGPLLGYILHLFHDDLSVVSFNSLSQFMETISSASISGVFIDSIGIGLKKEEIDQSLLAEHIWSLLNKDGTDLEILLYIPLLATGNTTLIQQLATMEDFFFRQGIAELIEGSPTSDLLPIARALSTDPHPQVARAGMKALLAVNKSSQSS